jgi:colicin import membrane protein
MTQIAEYTPTEAALAELRSRFESVVFDTTTTKGMQAAKEGRAEIRGYRVSLEKMRVEIKAPALERCRLIDTEAKRITAELEALEQPIDEAIKAEEQRKEREKAAKEQAERERIAALNARFDAIRNLPINAHGKPVADIDTIIAHTESMDPADFPADVQDAARFELRKALAGLRAARDARQAQDEEAARVVAEREELAKARAEIEAMRAAEEERHRREREQQERQDAERRRQADEEARAERDRLAEVAAAERAEREAAEEAERQRLKAEADKLAAERAEFQRQQAAATKAAKAKAIAEASLQEAVTEALALLQATQPEHMVTLKLASAMEREGWKKAA